MFTGGGTTFFLTSYMFPWIKKKLFEKRIYPQSKYFDFMGTFAVSLDFEGGKKSKRVSIYTSIFPAIFTEGNNFCDFLMLIWTPNHIQNGVNLIGKISVQGSKLFLLSLYPFQR